MNDAAQRGYKYVDHRDLVIVRRLPGRRMSGVVRRASTPKSESLYVLKGVGFRRLPDVPERIHARPGRLLSRNPDPPLDATASQHLISSTDHRHGRISRRRRQGHRVWHTVSFLGRAPQIARQGALVPSVVFGRCAHAPHGVHVPHGHQSRQTSSWTTVFARSLSKTEAVSMSQLYPYVVK